MVLLIVILIICIYVYSLKLSHPDYDIVTYDSIRDKVKSGDIILFVSLDTINQLYMMSYVTHIGVIYRRDSESTPLLIESFNPYRMPFFPKEYKSGIATCDLEHRLNSYRGFILYKELAKPISDHANADFADFIEYAKENMQYDKNVISGEIGKIILNTPFSVNVNCGTFTAMILMKLNLVPFSHFKERRKHHLLWTAGLTKLRNNSYKTPVYIYSEYFKVPDFSI